MNIKIKASGVYCLVGEDYDKVYHALQSQLGDGELQIFTERIPGHEYLQWELPGDGWQSLADGDPLLGVEVKKELYRRQQAISERFGTNQDMAQRVLSVPDDHYVYFKTDADGHLLIRLTAWGYRYPERIISNAATGEFSPEMPKENVSIVLLYDKQPVPGKPIKLNGFLRATDASGAVKIGELPVGYQFDVDVDALHRHIKVEKGEGYITLDITEYTILEVIVTKDVLPLSEAKIAVAYKGRNEELVTDANGYARAKFPLDPDHGFCTVSVEGESQQRPLDPTSTTFRFDLIAPPVSVAVVPPEDSLSEEIQAEITPEPEEPVQELPKVQIVPKVPVKGETEEEVKGLSEETAPIERKSAWWWIILAILTVLTYWVSLHFFI